MGEQARSNRPRPYRFPTTEDRDYFNTRSFHEITLWHRAMRARYRMRAKFLEIYGETLIVCATHPTAECVITIASPGPVKKRKAAPRPQIAKKVPGPAQIPRRPEAASRERKTRAQAEALRAELFPLQGGTCYICRHDLGEDRSLDHVWPVARGGRAPRNILLTHDACNNAKGDRVPTDAEMEYLKEINWKRDEEQDELAA